MKRDSLPDYFILSTNQYYFQNMLIYRGSQTFLAMTSIIVFRNPADLKKSQKNLPPSRYQILHMRAIFEIFWSN
jgi:hypothetical protein